MEPKFANGHVEAIGVILPHGIVDAEVEVSVFIQEVAQACAAVAEVAVVLGRFVS